MTAATTPPPLSDHLCFAIYSANIAINRTYLPVLGSLGLTYPQYLVLCAVAERDAQSIGGIAERLALEASTVTPLVKRMETAGLLTRKRNPADERLVVVSLTLQGAELYARAGILAQTLQERLGATGSVEIPSARSAWELVQRLGSGRVGGAPASEDGDV